MVINTYNMFNILLEKVYKLYNILINSGKIFNKNKHYFRIFVGI